MISADAAIADPPRSDSLASQSVGRVNSACLAFTAGVNGIHSFASLVFAIVRRFDHNLIENWEMMD
jgi:hypothetical protein